MKPSLLLFLFVWNLTVFWNTESTAQSSQTLKERMISGWAVMKVMTPKHGLSCQALKCSTRACDADTATASLRLWGSNYRQAVTPMIGMQAASAGAQNAIISVAGKRFPLVQSRASRGKLFIAQRPSDDALIMKLAAATPKGTITFSSDKGSAVFRLKGIERVLAFFEKECEIPRP